MKSNSGKIAVACCLGILLVGAGFLLFRGGSGKAAPIQIQVISDIGKFKVDIEAGKERAGFTGSPYVYVFVNPNDPDFAEIQAVLTDAKVSNSMTHFTGVLIDSKDESNAELERDLRDLGYRVIIRALNGCFIGGFKESFTAQQLADLLSSTSSNRPKMFLPSPLYGSLKNILETIDKIVEREGRQKADWYIQLMEEIEGSDSPSVVALKSRL